MTKVNQFKVKNQFTLSTPEGRFFQSYNSIIVFIPNNGKIQLDAKFWDYSKTTSKYRNQFLNEDTKTTQSKIASGEYILNNLN